MGRTASPVSWTGPAPGPVSLQPLTAADVDLLLAERAGEDGAGGFPWFGVTSGARLRTRAAADELLTPDGDVLAVHVGEELAGSVGGPGPVGVRRRAQGLR